VGRGVLLVDPHDGSGQAQRIGRYGGGQGLLEIGPVDLEVRRPELLLGLTADDIAADLGAVGPGAEAHVGRARGLFRYGVEQVQAA
jgi:hypothetical protein